MISPRALFGVAIRVLGIWFLTEAAYSAFWAVLKAKTAIGNANISSGEHAAFAFFWALLGLFLLCAADPLVWLAYGYPSKVTAPDAANNPSTGATPDGEQQP